MTFLINRMTLVSSTGFYIECATKERILYMKLGIYPGSFDPVTLGHLDIIERSSRLVDKLVLGVLKNSSKTPLFSSKERVELLKYATKDIKNIEIIDYDGLLVDFARELKADAIIRGLRAVTDFEYELQLAQTNKKLYPDVETIFLATNVNYAYLSSSVVREIAKYGGDIKQFVPESIVQSVYDKYTTIRRV